jgi:predicted DNA-binding protein (MmcQ/YjbR family)
LGWGWGGLAKTSVAAGVERPALGRPDEAVTVSRRGAPRGPRGLVRARAISRGYGPGVKPLRPAGPVLRGGASSRRVLARLRTLCLALPGAVEKPSHGEPTWFAGTGKVFATFDDHHHGAEHASVWLPMPFGAQETLVARDPARFFRPPYVGASGWVGVVLDGKPDWAEVARLVREGYLHVASARLRSALSGETAPPAPAPRGAGGRRGGR